MFTTTWIRCFMFTALLYTTVKYQGTHGICNCVFSLEGKTYNITSLESKDDTARFTVEHQLYMYSYNPCRSFHFPKAPGFGDCKEDLAICWWMQDRIYRKIGNQSTAQCGFNKRYRMPMLQYAGDSYVQKSIVLLKCKQTKEEANFEVVDTSGPGEFVFKLTHKCACPNACVISPSGHSTKYPITTTAKHTSKDTSTTDPIRDPTDNILVKEVVSGVAGGVSVIIVIAVIVIFRTNVIELWRRVFRREPNNERRPILDIAGVVEDTQYNIPAGASEGSELTLGNGSSCSDIIVQKKKNDLNSKINTYAEGLG